MAYNEVDFARFKKNELKPGDTFQFACAMCGSCCRNRREAILMTGADIFRAAKALGVSVEEVLPKNFETYVGEDSHVPLYVLAERLDGSCRFLRKGRCLIQQDKPAVCALFPLGRFFDVRDNSFHYFLNPDRCNAGQVEGKTWTLEEWLDEFHIRETEAMTATWHKLLTRLAEVTCWMKKEDICGDLLEDLRRVLYLGYDTGAPYIEQVEARIPSALDVFKRK
ncbi:YkgJ family cysteine cluster protein [Butyricicoccus sp. 1XD8-22]|nr:YkgJ family cysteine cluster protein [Butyricicoccus sp. 1XD8-22]